MSGLILGEEADAPGRAVWEGFAPLFEKRVSERMAHEAKQWSRCGHVDPTNPRLLHFLGEDVAWTFWQILTGTSGDATKLRDRLREALHLTLEYDHAAPRIRELAAAIRRREVYNVIRRAAALLEDLGEADPAAVLAEWAERHEPQPEVDGVAFSRIRRRKSERRRGD